MTAFSLSKMGTGKNGDWQRFPKGSGACPRFFLLLSLLLACAVVPPAFCDPLHTFTLDNGLEVLVLPDESSGAVAVQVWYRVGGRDEGEGEHGLAHLFEHMMFRGTDTVGPEEFIRRIQAVGGRSNAWTSEDVTVYHETLPAQHLELALELEADRMANLALDAGILDTERKVVLEELRLRMENDQLGAAYSWYKKLFFTVHPYHHDVLGDAEQLNNFTVEQCRDFYHRYYQPGNAVLVVAGSVDRLEVEQLVRRHFGPLPAVEAAERPVPTPEPYGEALTRHTLELPVEVPVVGLGFHTPEASHPDYPALEVIRELLTGGSRARLTNSLVREQRLAVYVDTIFERTIDPSGLVAFAVFLPSVRSKTVERAMWEEIRRLREEEVPEDELGQARRRLLVRRLFGLSGPEGAASALGWATVIEGDAERFADHATRIEAVTAGDVRRVAAIYLAEENAVVGWIKPDEFRFTYWIFGILKSLLGR
jgi:zinc protease